MTTRYHDITQPFYILFKKFIEIEESIESRHDMSHRHHIVVTSSSHHRHSDQVVARFRPHISEWWPPRQDSSHVSGQMRQVALEDDVDDTTT